MTTLEKVKNILAEYVGATDVEITEETSIKDLKIDSLDMVEIIMSIEDEFGINVEDPSVIVTIGDFVKLIEGK